MKRAPRVDQLVLPGVFVSRDGCEFRGGRLYFEDRPVDGAVFVTSPGETHDRAQVDRYRDGRRIGAWQDPIAGIDMTCCYVGNDVDPDPPDTTAYLSHSRQTRRCTGVHRFLYGDTRGMVEYERKVGQAESYSIARDEWVVSSLYRQVLRSSDEADAEASWSWFPDGSLRYVSVRLQIPGHPDTGRNGSLSMTFDREGRAEELTVRGPYWELVAAHNVEADRWIPRSEHELVDLDFAAESKVWSLDQSPSLLASADRWLANVDTLASVTDRVDFGLIRRLCDARDFDSLRLPSLGSPTISVTLHALLEFGLQFMRQRRGRTVEFGGPLFTTLSDLERILDTWKPGRGLVVLDDDVRNVVGTRRGHAQRCTCRPGPLEREARAVQSTVAAARQARSTSRNRCRRAECSGLPKWTAAARNRRPQRVAAGVRQLARYDSFVASRLSRRPPSTPPWRATRR